MFGDPACAVTHACLFVCLKDSPGPNTLENNVAPLLSTVKRIALSDAFFQLQPSVLIDKTSQASPAQPGAALAAIGAAKLKERPKANIVMRNGCVCITHLPYEHVTVADYVRSSSK